MKTLSLLFALAATAAAQSPTNDAPNPYQTVEGWAKLPAGRTWGSLSAVDIDKDGQSVWVAERCGANNCLNSDLDPVMLFDKDGNLVRSFGKGMILSPHGITVDRDGNVWIVDCSCTLGGRGGAPAPANAGHQIYEFSPDGKLLMTLGKAGGGKDSSYFWQPNDVLVAPDGSIFVSEGHSSNNGATARLYKFDKTGKLLRTFGSWGKGADADKFDQPHALAMDSKGRLFVGDRGNNLVKIYDQNFNLVDTMSQFSRASGIWIDKDDNIYVADSESGSVARDRAEWKRGIRIGSLKTGKVTAFIPDPGDPAPTSPSSSAEGVAVDRNGVIYGAEVGQRALKRYVRKP